MSIESRIKIYYEGHTEVLFASTTMQIKHQHVPSRCHNGYQSQAQIQFFRKTLDTMMLFLQIPVDALPWFPSSAAVEVSNKRSNMTSFYMNMLSVLGASDLFQTSFGLAVISRTAFEFIRIRRRDLQFENGVFDGTWWQHILITFLEGEQQSQSFTFWRDLLMIRLGTSSFGRVSEHERLWSRVLPS